MSEFRFSDRAESGKSPVQVEGITVSDVDITKIAGTAVGAANPLYVAPGTGASFTVTGPLTDTQLRNSDVKVTLDSEVVTSNIQAYRSSDTSYQPVRLDKATNALVTIDYGHHEAHDGDCFYYHDVISLSGTSGQDYLLTTPDTTKYAHFGLEIDYNDGSGTTEIFESADRTGTTLQTSFNRERNTGGAATMTIHKSTSGGTTDGTRIFWKRVGSGKTSGGTVGTAEERILKRNTKYVLRVYNNAATTNNVTVVIRWYEHTNIA